jgi:hypothetical protein
MIDLNTFIKKIEKDLILRKYSSEEILELFYNLSTKNKVLCNYILNSMIENFDDHTDLRSESFEFSSEERILVCRLIPLYFALNTSNPTWSSYALSKTIKAASNIKGIKLSEIVIAFLEILCEFSTPLNKGVYTFCIEISKEFTIHYRKRRNEFENLITLENSCYKSCASAAFLRYNLMPIEYDDPIFILDTMKALIQNEYLKEFCEANLDLFENKKYTEIFLHHLSNSKLSRENEKLILLAINQIKEE